MTTLNAELAETAEKDNTLLCVFSGLCVDRRGRDQIHGYSIQ